MGAQSAGPPQHPGPVHADPGGQSVLELHAGKLQLVSGETQTQSPSTVPILAQGPRGGLQRSGTSPQTYTAQFLTGGVPAVPAAKAGLVMMTGAAQTIPPVTTPFLIKSRLERRCSASQLGGFAVRTAGPPRWTIYPCDGSKTHAWPPVVVGRLRSNAGTLHSRQIARSALVTRVRIGP
jgi:hypothetical protein